MKSSPDTSFFRSLLNRPSDKVDHATCPPILVTAELPKRTWLEAVAIAFQPNDVEFVILRQEERSVIPARDPNALLYEFVQSFSPGLPSENSASTPSAQL